MPARLNAKSLEGILGQQITPQKPFRLEEFYSRGSKPHYMQMSIGRRPRQRTNELVIHIDSLLDENDEFEDPFSPSRVMQQLTELRFESEFSFDVVFTLGRSASRILFPLKLPFLPGTIIDEFRGFRGVKHEEGKIAYELSLESPELKELYVNVEMKRMEVFHSDLLHQVIREAGSVVSGIIPDSQWSE